jgi:hypothetical protein
VSSLDNNNRGIMSDSADKSSYERQNYSDDEIFGSADEGNTKDEGISMKLVPQRGDSRDISDEVTYAMNASSGDMEREEEQSSERLDGTVLPPSSTKINKCVIFTSKFCRRGVTVVGLIFASIITMFILGYYVR